MTLSQTNRDQLRASENARAAGRIARIGPARRLEAVERLMGGGRTAAERFLHYARANGIRLENLWCLLDDRQAIAATVLLVPSPGRTAMVFTSRPEGDDDDAPVGQLIDHACRMAGPEVELAQALLEPVQTAERRAFLGAGFVALATLSYLERAIGAACTAAPRWPAGATTEPYREASRDDFLAALDASYERTLDCPGLYGLRRTTDILDGHRATGEFDPALWTLLRLEGRPAGVILLNPFPAQKTIELVYLGLAPFCRGAGLGRQLLRHGLQQLADRRETLLTLAVDERNVPALRLYRAEGMRPVVRRVALIRSLRGH